MSGSKAFTVMAGVAGVPAEGVLAGLAGVAVAATSVASMTGRAFEAYQERMRREREAARQREQAIQQKIAQIRAGTSSSSGPARIPVELPDTGTSQINPAVASDVHRRVQALRSRLPNIRAEYQTLIEQQLLNAQNVQQALQRTEEALNGNDLTAAQTYLQALDDARIQVIQKARAQWTSQIEYLQERLEELQTRLPQAIHQQMQTRIDEVSNNWQQLSEADIETLHQLINEVATQADQIQEVAANLAASWSQAGYVARVVQIDDGDVVIEIETHEGANTQMRVQFYGQQIELEGPRDQEGVGSCAERTMAVMRLFQEQGYQLEWNKWNGEAVPEEMRSLAALPAAPASPQTSGKTPQSSHSQPSPRRLEGQGY
ncbi:MAG: hypothetical protein V7L13_07405 [Nostoc sp.]|uniref:hypothetical protein n=1 Tax=Nostoc sp. TaxID=1180 RepID=UPI002FF47CD6